MVAAFSQEGEPGQYLDFALGLTRAIVVALTRFTKLFVFGPETCARFGIDVDIARLRGELDVEYILYGGASLTATSFAVDVLLVETSSRRTVWAE